MAVTSTNNLRKGSTGSDVVELQKHLNNSGYNLDTDGIFGDKTLAAVQDYQKKNGLTVDGIVGTNTWGALTKAQSSSLSAATPAAAAPAETKAPTFEYTPSDTVAQADALLQQQLANKPGEWQGGTWSDDLNDKISQILNREKFSYDLNGDALYQQYKDQYTTQGKLAMMDTMGQAAAMTGGYGNSYAQTAGQQAYQGYLQQLNDVVPELYGMALDQYNQEGQALYDQASILAGMEEQEYGRYQDKLSQYYTDLNYLTENARYMSETEYQKALDDFNIKYSAYRDTVGDQQWQSTFDEGVRQYNEQFDYQKNQDILDREWNQKMFDYQKGQDFIANSLAAAASKNQTSGSVTDGVSENVLNKAASFTDNTDLANYLDGLTESGVITEEQADALYAENKQADKAALNERSWVLEDDGGTNWFWGIDNNATVKDQYGNIYRLDKLIDALVAEGMSKSDAKTYVENLQKKLGA